ncbi:CheB methylesterase domain-containing protein [Candidatus Sulfurimonas baltica]|uniref:protein-glutamate methylesterase n=1 Tax=Candidatus Sulfurimonas baltica TaxID=2740404 RepID=A0A7S7RMW8_9BACT|nr:CheB methylesterase domain-containing protein [Candidatus Sulfurimonas baltica]QOY51914.1 chemotaxis protein CheB [Candidatus Sulfurimonas baltica]
MKHSVPRKIVLIGASTGGPGQIERIIKSLPQLSDLTIIIAQHMIDIFLPSFAKRLQSISVNPVYMATDGLNIDVNHIYISNGLTSIAEKGSQLYFNIQLSDKHQYNPDINTLFSSLVPFSKNIEILSIILTGIGDDGIIGCRLLSINGARCITESEKSAIVDGMPFRARQDVPNIEVSDINEIINSIKEFCS